MRKRVEPGTYAVTVGDAHHYAWCFVRRLDCYCRYAHATAKWRLYFNSYDRMITCDFRSLDSAEGILDAILKARCDGFKKGYLLCKSSHEQSLESSRLKHARRSG